MKGALTECVLLSSKWLVGVLSLPCRIKLQHTVWPTSARPLQECTYSIVKGRARFRGPRAWFFKHKMSQASTRAHTKARAKLELCQFMIQLELKWAKEWAKLELLKRWANLNRVVFTIQAWAWVENLVRFSLTHFPFCTSLKEGDPWCNSKVSQLQPRGYGSKPWKPPLCLWNRLCTSNPPQTLQQEELVHWVALTSLESLRSGRAQARTWASSFIINPK